MRILLTGRNGQIGWELERALAALGEVVATERSTLNLADPDSIRRVVREAKADVIVNAAAYTAVDKAESEPELAMQVNGVAPGILAEEARRLGSILVHYSTDYVFDGAKAGPYSEDDAPNPLNAYGKSKLAGEQAIATVAPRYLTLRTSWVYGARGSNFLLTMLRLAKDRAELRIVDDQIGAPSWCRSIALATREILAGGAVPSGLYHLTAQGQTSWHGFATAIFAIARGAGMSTPIVRRISSGEYPSAARRPGNSLLSCARLRGIRGVELPGWLPDLAKCMAEVEGLRLGGAGVR